MSVLAFFKAKRIKKTIEINLQDWDLKNWNEETIIFHTKQEVKEEIKKEVMRQLSFNNNLIQEMAMKVIGSSVLEDAVKEAVKEKMIYLMRSF